MNEQPTFYRRASSTSYTESRTSSWMFFDRGIYKHGKDGQNPQIPPFSSAAIEWIIRGDSTDQDLRKVGLADKGDILSEWSEQFRRGLYPRTGLDGMRTDFTNMQQLENHVITYLSKKGTYRTLEKIYQKKQAGKKGAEARYNNVQKENNAEENESS